jgi:hypothetical protein
MAAKLHAVGLVERHTYIDRVYGRGRKTQLKDNGLEDMNRFWRPCTEPLRQQGLNKSLAGNGRVHG